MLFLRFLDPWLHGSRVCFPSKLQKVWTGIDLKKLNQILLPTIFSQVKVLKDYQVTYNKRLWETSSTKSINTFEQSYDYIIKLIRRGKPIISFLRIEWSWLVKHWVPFIQGCLVPNLVEIGSVVLEKTIVNISYNIFIILFLFLFGKGRGPSYEKIWIPFSEGFTQRCFVPSLVETGPVFLEKKTMYFCYFVIISPWKRVWPFILTNFNSLYRGIFSAKFIWNWASGFASSHIKV